MPNLIKKYISMIVLSNSKLGEFMNQYKIPTKKLLVGIFWCGVTCGATTCFLSNIKAIIDVCTAVGVGIFFAIVGLGIFKLRCKYRLSYGIVETGFGFFSIIYFLFTIKSQKIAPAELIGILGGLYVIVRGLDSIGTGIEKDKDLKDFSKKWHEKWFPK